MEKITRFVPLGFFTIFAIGWFISDYESLDVINYTALVVTALLITQMFVNNKIAGFAISVLAVIFSIYMLGPVAADYKTFGTFSNGMRVRGVLFCIVIVLAILHAYYYIKYKNVAKPL
jgi:hypothetical protein